MLDTHTVLVLLEFPPLKILRAISVDEPLNEWQAPIPLKQPEEGGVPKMRDLQWALKMYMPTGLGKEFAKGSVCVS